MRIKRVVIILSLVLVPFFTNCATSESGNLEDARFALDSGDYDGAITAATAALVADATNVEASRILGSAYFGRSGVDFLDLAQAALDLDTSSLSNFQQIADVLPDSTTTTVAPGDMRSAVEALLDTEGVDGTDLSGDVADAAFDLGLMEGIEHFAIGVYSSSYFGTFDVTQITDEDATNVLTDLVNFDNHLIESGVDAAESFILEIRQTFCILEPISTGAGFTTEEYQAFVGCQLSDDPATFDTASLTAAIATCTVLDPDGQSAAVEACFDEDTAL